MSDLRKFCWGTYVGLGGGSALQNHGLWETPAGVDGLSAIIALALMLGCLAVIIFGQRGTV